MYRIIKNSAAVLMGVWASASLLALHFFPNRWILLFVLVLWACVLSVWHFFLDRIFQIHQKQMAIMIITIVSSFLLFSVAEEAWLRLFLAILSGFFIGTLSFLAIEREEELAVMEKSVRRIHMMLWVWNAYAIAASLLGFSLFYREIPFWVFQIAGAAVLGAIAWHVWRMYVQGNVWLWMVLVTLSMLEWMWVVHLLPFGYLVSGLLVTWIWYIAQLMIRFHLTAPGILWRKQAVFLAGNGALFAGVLFAARWA